VPPVQVPNPLIAVHKPVPPLQHACIGHGVAVQLVSGPCVVVPAAHVPALPMTVQVVAVLLQQACVGHGLVGVHEEPCAMNVLPLGQPIIVDSTHAAVASLQQAPCPQMLNGETSHVEPAELNVFSGVGQPALVASVQFPVVLLQHAPWPQIVKGDDPQDVLSPA
jgi:hypothetical protein